MSFNASDKSGEAVGFDPTILIPFGGYRKGLSYLIPTASKIGQQGLRDVAENFNTVSKPAGSIFDNILNSLKGILPKVENPLKTGVGQEAKEGTSKIIPKFEIGTKAAITGTTIAATGLASLVTLTQTPGGQNTVSTFGNVATSTANVASSVTDFIKQNPFVLVGGLIILGIVVLKK